MPRLSDAMQEGLIAHWLVDDGGRVEAGQEVVEVETDKATMPCEAEIGGFIHHRAAEGDTVPVGGLIAVITDVEGPSESAAVPPPQSTTTTAARHAVRAASSDALVRTNASPVARRIAVELGISLADVTGSGRSGRIVKADVLAAPAAQQAPAPSLSPSSSLVSSPTSEIQDGEKGQLTTQDLTRVQQLIARRMTESKTAAPDFVLKTQVDMEAAVALREQLRGFIGKDTRLPSYNDFVVKACAIALRRAPLANASYVEGRFEYHPRVNIGIAVAAPDGLMVPTIFDADHKTLGLIASHAHDLAEKVRQARITPAELSGGTFSVSNLGMFGVDEFAAVINPPQAAILAVGALKQRAVVYHGELAARYTMTISLSCDHRILYGANAAEFLAHVRELLEGPGALVL